MADEFVTKKYDRRLFRDSIHFPWAEAVFRKEQRDELSAAILKHWRGVRG